MTVRAYESILRRAHDQLPHGLPVATTPELQEWIWHPRHRAAKTRALYRSAIVAFFRWAKREDIVDYDPTERLPKVRPPEKKPRPCTNDELALILDRSPEPVRTWAILAAYAGCRAGEVAAMDRLDITRETVRIHGKGGHERVVPTHELVWRAVRDLPPGPIAGGRTPMAVSSIARRVFHKVGAQISIHRLRDWYATFGYLATKDLRAVQHLMGHRSPSTTAGYIQVADDALRAVVKGLPVLHHGTSHGTTSTRARTIVGGRRHLDAGHPVDR